MPPIPTGDARYILTFMVMGISDKAGMQVGSSPVGPFGELLVSYNTITFNFWEDIQKDAGIYHLRFIKVKYR